MYSHQPTTYAIQAIAASRVATVHEGRTVIMMRSTPGMCSDRHRIGAPMGKKTPYIGHAPMAKSGCGGRLIAKSTPPMRRLRPDCSMRRRSASRMLERSPASVGLAAGARWRQRM